MSSQSSASHHSFSVDESQPKNRNLLVWGMVILSIFGIAIFVLTNIFYQTLEQKVYTNVLAPTSEDLEKLRADQFKQLQTYGFIDKPKQIVHIPIEEAIKQEVEEAKRRSSPHGIQEM